MENNQNNQNQDPRKTVPFVERTTKLYPNNEEEININERRAKLEAEREVRTKLDVGDVINGYKIGELLPISSGEADIHFCYKDGEKFIAKIYRTNTQINEDLLKRIVSLHHPNLLSAVAIGNHRGWVYEIQPYYEKGNALQNFARFDLTFLKTVFIPQINAAIKALHERDITHNDIKPHNILLTNNRQNVVLGDFGIIQCLEGQAAVTKRAKAQTIIYSAPEFFKYTSRKTDYFAFGMTLLHLSFKVDPFANIPDAEAQKIMANSSINIPKEIDSDIADLIFGLIQKDPEQRFGAAEVEKWLKNNKIFHDYRRQRKTTLENDIGLNYAFQTKTGEIVNFTNLHDLAIAMLVNLRDGVIHFRNNKIFIELTKIDHPNALVAKDIYRNYLQTDSTLGLYLTLYRLVPKLPLVYNGISFTSLSDFVNTLADIYPNVPSYVLSEEFFDDVLIPRVPLENRPILERIKKETKAGSTSRLDLFLMYFSVKERLFDHKKTFNNLPDFIENSFNGTEIVPFSSEGPLLFEFLSSRYKIEQTKLNSIVNIKNAWERYARLSYLILGSFPFTIANEKVKSVKDFIALLDNCYHHKTSFSYQAAVSFIESGRFLLMTEISGALKKEALDELKSASNLVDHIYYFLCPNRSYRGCKNLKELMDYVNAEPHFFSIQNEILGDPLFILWRKGLGR